MSPIRTRREAPPVPPAKSAVAADPRESAPADMNRYIGWSHLPPGGEIGVIESVEPQGATIWLYVRLSDDKIDRRCFVPGHDFLLDERGFAADADFTRRGLTDFEWLV